jgi:methionine-rich copper-binding protein CopC
MTLCHLPVASWLRACAVATCVLLAAVPQALAHDNTLRSTQPADGATLREPISQVVATYAAAPNVQQAVVTSPDENERHIAVQVDGSSMRIPFRPDAPGQWRLAWGVMQGDGHEIAYAITLRVTPAAVHAVPPPQQSWSEDLHRACAAMLRQLLDMLLLRS